MKHAPAVWGRLTAASLTLVVSCSNIVGGEGPAPLGKTTQPKPPASQDIDLLLVVDNSSSMADKQKVFADSLPSLLSSLVYPPCIDTNGNLFVSGDCLSPSTRVFAPVRSIHLGVISSSLGGLGADACGDLDSTRNNNDHGRLLRRAPGGGTVPTYLDGGFLVWDPDQALSPPGEDDFALFVQHAVDIVKGAGERGCGYEMPLESTYRFLVDPSPYSAIQKGGGAIPEAVITGLDTDLLAERAHFLRDQSVVSVVLLSDENDCSFAVGTRESGSQGYALMNPTPFFRASSACAEDPDGACCYSCALPVPPGCAADESCSGDPRYDPADDSVNLRCFHQRQRYGLDFLYPTARYVNAFSKKSIFTDASSLDVPKGSEGIANPLFAQDRDPAQFFLTTIVGLPWQSIAIDSSDPQRGIVDATMSSTRGLWQSEVGDPSTYLEPTDPLMIESPAIREGVTASSPNGGDRPIDVPPDDLQYACIFLLDQPIADGSDCRSNPEGNPICQGSQQIAAKAYPGLRELSVVEGLGEQGLPGSICSPAMKPTSDASDGLYGYRVVFDTLVKRMARSLAH